MRKTYLLLALAALLCLLCACAPAAPQDTTAPTTEAAEVWIPFTGIRKDYVFLHTQERDQKWEEDILYMAETYLKDYALLTRFPSRIEWPDDVEYSDCFYDPEFREFFLDEVNAMIQDIPTMTDTQIHWRIQKLIATFGDAHASVYPPDTDYFPILFLPFFSEDGVTIHVITTPEGHEDQLLWELEMINRYTVEELIELLRPYVPHENDYWLVNQIFSMDGGYIIREDVLKIAGILAEDSDTLEYRFLDPNGGVVSFTLDALSPPQLKMLTFIGHTPSHAYALMYTDQAEKNYWFRHIPEEDMLYIRINSFNEDPACSFLTLGNGLLQTDREAGGVGKLVVDLRDNPGGYKFQGYYEFVTVLQRIAPDSLYVLIDGNTFSNAVLMASTIRRSIPEAVLVGTPAGQPANFFAGIWDGEHVMPNCGTTLRLPTAWYCNLPEDEADALMPDVLVYPALEDYANSVDTILEAVKKML